MEDIKAGKKELVNFSRVMFVGAGCPWHDPASPNA
jgi:hypothetical protein